MLLFRITNTRHAHLLDGQGARLFPGRWNSMDVPMVYCAGNPALCALEVLVHITSKRLASSDLALVTLLIPEYASMTGVSIDALPDKWNIGAYQHCVRQLGDSFINARTHLIMRVPATTMHGEVNYLINPLHIDTHRIQIVSIEAFKFDQRLVNKYVGNSKRMIGSRK